MVTINDVAARCGVAKSTVSNALNGKGNVRDDVRDRILAVVREMGYVPNQTARSLSVGRREPAIDPLRDVVSLMEAIRGLHHVGSLMLVSCSDLDLAPFIPALQGSLHGISIRSSTVASTFADGVRCSRVHRGADAVVFASPYAAAGYAVSVMGARVGCIVNDMLLAGLEREVFAVGESGAVLRYGPGIRKRLGGDDGDLLD